jgi:diacylglycerol kinase family enzyme
LKEKAEALGAEVALLEGPGTVDVAALARGAVAAGADLLGVAGGDGTQALVAGIAAEHDLPFLVISAGTRNHFAMDLGWTGTTRPRAWTLSPATAWSSGSIWASSVTARS